MFIQSLVIHGLSICRSVASHWLSNTSSLRMVTQVLALGMEPQSWKPENNVSPHNCPTFQSKSLRTLDWAVSGSVAEHLTTATLKSEVYQAVWRSSLGGTFMVAEHHVLSSITEGGGRKKVFCTLSLSLPLQFHIYDGFFLSQLKPCWKDPQHHTDVRFIMHVYLVQLVMSINSCLYLIMCIFLLCIFLCLSWSQNTEQFQHTHLSVTIHNLFFLF